MKPTLSPALQQCRNDVQQWDHDRYLTVLFAPPDRRDLLWPVYAFNLELARVREQVSEPMLGEIRLQWWREALDGVWSGAPRPHHVAEALTQALSRIDLPRSAFETLIDCRVRELYDDPFATLAELDNYCAASAGELTWLAALALGGNVASEAVEHAARHAGQAWALTGLIRATPWHAARGRIYIPDDLAPDAEALLAGRMTPPTQRALQHLAATAAEHVQSARRLRGDVPPRPRRALLIATLAWSYLTALHKMQSDPFRFVPERGAARRLMAMMMNVMRQAY